jgi:hypothetical protein
MDVGGRWNVRVLLSSMGAIWWVKGVVVLWRRELRSTMEELSVMVQLDW